MPVPRLLGVGRWGCGCICGCPDRPTVVGKYDGINISKGTDDMKLAIISASFALILGGSAAFAGMVETVESAKGPVVAAADGGMTLYTFQKDKAGASTCYDACAMNWPPFLATEEDEDKVEGDLTVIDRTDGTYQWAMKGMPLYFLDRKSTRLNSSHRNTSRMPSSA